MKKIIIPEDLEAVDTDELDNPFEMDEKGFFLIRVIERKIEVGHVDNNSYKMTKKFIGIDVDKMYKAIIAAELVSRLDHCAYLGKEFGRAKYALDNDLEYIQD